MRREQRRSPRSAPRSVSLLSRPAQAGPPAGFPAGRLLRSRTNSLDTALGNAIEALNLLRTGEAALAGMSALLHELRRLAERAADQRAHAEGRALQREAAGALSTLDEIARQAAYGPTPLLDGSAGVAASVLDSKHILSATPTPNTPAGYIDLQIVQAASRALAVGATSYADLSDPVKAAGELTVNGVHLGAFAPATHTARSLLDALSEASACTGVRPGWVNGHLELRHLAFGSNCGIVLAETAPVLNEGNTLVRYGEDAVAMAMYGDGSVEKLDAGAGLALRGRRSGFIVMLTEAGNRAGLELPRAAHVTHRELSFRLGSEQERRVTLSLPDLGTSHLGIVAPLSTIDLSTAAGAVEAMTVVEEASGQVERLREELARVCQEEMMPCLDALTASRRRLVGAAVLGEPELERELVEVICFRIAQEPEAAVRTQGHCLPHNVMSLLW